jgi:hypothetical protein
MSYVITSNVGSDLDPVEGYKRGAQNKNDIIHQTAITPSTSPNYNTPAAATKYQPTSTTTMSHIQTELRVLRYQRHLIWFQQQQEMAPINTIHHSLLYQIYDYLINNADIWGSPDAHTLCGIADTLVTLYDRPLDVVDLTREGGEDGAGGGNRADNSGIAD